MPVIQHLQSTNIWKAFFLNSIASTVVIFISMTAKNNLDTYTNKNITRKTNFKSVILTLLITFTSYMLAFTIMYYIFGFGAGMLANPS